MALTVIPLSGLANDVVDSISAGAGGGGPRIANVQIANSSWGLLDDTAVSTDGGYVLINGSGFASGCSVLVANSQATPVTFANSSLLRVEVPAKSASTYAVYVLNPDGGTAIGINALTYSAFPAWATSSTLSGGSVDAAISVQLSASDATTYTLQAGSSLPANTTLASNGLFSGTITGINEETTYTFTVEATDAENQNTPRTFSITITVGDSNFKSTTLLLNADANTFVRDASNNAFNITVNGDTKPSAFSPFNTNWSNYFDGTGDRLTWSGTTLAGDFTVECWVYKTAVDASGYTNIFSSFGAGLNNQFTIDLTTAGSIALELAGGSTPDIPASGTAVTPNVWHHLAWVREGSTLRAYVDGVQQGTGTSSASFSLGCIGAFNPADATGYEMNGYISNARITNACLYPSGTTFTPSTTPLTTTVSSGTVQLLTCQSSRIIDNSTNAFAITRAGEVSVRSFGPFTETDTTTGSGYFDGTGDFLDPTTSNSAFSFDTGNFTVEAWIYPNSLSNYMGIVGQALTSADTQHSFFVFANGQVTHQSYFAVGLATTTSNITTGMWHHVAAVRSGANGAIFINGVRAASNTAYTKNYSNTNPIRIGAAADAGSAVFNGYISNARVIKGTAVYDPTQSTITVPTTSLTAVTNTQLLTLQNRIGVTNHTFVDESGHRNIVTRSGNASKGSFSPFSPTGWSGYFDGTGDYLNVASNAAFGVGSGDFTIECWIYLTQNFDATGQGVVTASYNTNFAAIGVNSGAGNKIDFYVVNTILTTGTNYIGLNVWTHLAFVRSSGTTKIYFNGVQVASSGSLTGTGSAAALYVGTLSHDLNQEMTGYISNLRLVKGTAVYTSTFTPSTTPLTPVSNTQLLILRSNTIEDDSPNNLAITKVNDVKIVPFSPFKSHTITANSYSVYFDGTGDYLSTTATAVGTNSFTVEAWVYLSTGSSYMGVYSSTEDTSGVGINLSIVNDNTVQGFVGRGNSATFLNSATPLSLKTWYHIAFVRNGSTLNLYVNGTSVDSDTSSASITATSAVVGRFYLSYNGFYMNGYISNVRLINGTAQYTSNFTPPTAQLTAVSNTQLLTCQTSTLVDNSTSLRTIIPLGNVHVKKFNPFGESVTSSIQEYNPATHQGSVYVDGSDYLAISNTNMVLGTSDFEISFYMYLITNNGYIIGTGNSTGSWAFNLGDTTYLDFRVNNLAAASVTSTSIPGGNLLGQWVKVRIERISNVAYLWVNEKFQASATVSTDLSQSALGIGSFGQTATYASAAYVADLEIRKGSRTSSSTHGLILNMPFNHGGIVDITGRNVLECVGDARVSTNTKKFGTGSMYFDGTGDYLKSRLNDPIVFLGVENWTIEGWVYLNTTSGTQTFIAGQSDYATPANASYGLYVTGSSAGDFFYGSSFVSLGAPGLSATTWTHCAWVRNGSTITFYRNGTSITSVAIGANSINNGTTNPLCIGGANNGANQLNGYIDDLRITRGYARYTANFTPPISALLTK